MRRFIGLSTALLVTVTAAACGGGEAGEEADTDTPQATTPAPGGDTGTAAAGGGEMGTPDWFQVDHDARTVTMDIVAGQDGSNNYWNFNGYTSGNATITVPAGYTVTINFSNQDPNMAHSVGISERASGQFSATPAATPVFEGAISSNPTSMTDATTTGESETITFTAATAGNYAMLCYVPGHAATGMWINFNVVAGQEAGVETM